AGPRRSCGLRPRLRLRWSRPRQRRPKGRGGRSGRWRDAGRTRLSTWAADCSLEGGKEGGDVGDVLLREALGLGTHGRMPALVVAVLVQGLAQVLGRLAADLGHLEARVRILVAGQAVAALAGI